MKSTRLPVIVDCGVSTTCPSEWMGKGLATGKAARANTEQG
jgi:hypothetical protein